MKKIIVLLIVCFLSLSSFSFAAIINEVETQGKGKVGISLDSEYATGRKIKGDSYEVRRVFLAGGVASFSLTTQLDTPQDKNTRYVSEYGKSKLWPVG